MSVNMQNKEYEVVVKNLRGREVSCLVTAVTLTKKVGKKSDATKEESIKSISNASESKLKQINSHEDISCLATANATTSINSTTEIIPSEDSIISVEYHASNSEEESDMSKAQSSNNTKDSSKSSVGRKDSVLLTTVVEKTPYRRRTVNVSSIARRVQEGEGEGERGDGERNIYTSPLKYKRAYTRRNIILELPKQRNSFDKAGFRATPPANNYSAQLPRVPHNTPATSRADRKDVTPLAKRKPGRPPGRRSVPVIISLESESTSSGASQDLEGCSEDNEPLSEYELQRQRNIEENMKMLRQIFIKEGLDLGEKTPSSDTPKSRKTYSRIPPPPPRAKSARLEDKRSTDPLDFSGLKQRLSLIDQ